MNDYASAFSYHEPVVCTGDDKRVGWILNERFASPALHLFLCPVNSFIGRGLCEETRGDSSEPKATRRVALKASARCRFSTQSIFPSPPAQIHSALCVETVQTRRSRLGSQLDPGQSTGARHPTGPKSPLHFFHSFCGPKMKIWSSWFI